MVAQSSRVSGQRLNVHGHGVIREVITTLVDKWFLSRPSCSNISSSIDDKGILVASTPCSSIKPSPLQTQNAYLCGALVTLSILWCERLPRHFSELAWMFHASDRDIKCLTRSVLSTYSPFLLSALDNMREGQLSAIQPIMESYLDFPVCICDNQSS